MSNDTATAEVLAEVEKLEADKAAYISILMERNFLKQAMADFNFHHNAHDGIVFTDTDNKVVYANPYFLEMMNIADPAEIMNKPLPEYMWSSADDAPQLFKDVRENGFVRERELSLYNQKREPVFAMCSSVASKDDVGNFVGTEIMLCNITSKRRIQTELMQRQQQLERVTEFARSTLQVLQDLVQQNASQKELKDILKKLEGELNQTA
jgi:PAS domain-containing protein